MLNLSTDVSPPKLTKLTIHKFHIFQNRRFGTNSSHGVKFVKCEICGSTQLYISPGKYSFRENNTKIFIEIIYYAFIQNGIMTNVLACNEKKHGIPAKGAQT